uniref:PD-(D/E)XK nuclease family transposase n=1 Tax=Candidatus Kentrum eta TaxID=2126337 RepID=A0A450VDC5_9GAMM|nr:MAG: PD-(D/E)XK nuclease family transposase [Candidatus Kentron sp. H]VFK02760.1 MAG: PD-(D/E)XK nuclease family transposase [Candidatus Kentron sp. H]VFK05619.1 MAG: PD-(D/E)XK nuclease family transposase [Candidatus Kentron sp. H]
MREQRTNLFDKVPCRKMQIANPLYDVVFKHLMEDFEAAKLLISTILGREITVLAPLPQERTLDLEQRSFTVYRLDYAARIQKTDGGFEQVIIEIQKAKFAADIMRFRRYLGNQYQRKNNTFVVRMGGEEIKKPLPIVAIYFLGYRLDHMTAPVIKVARQSYDITTGERLFGEEEFIESLTHDAFIIQIPCLRPDRKTDVEQLLGLFDQRRATSGDEHILEIDEETYPEKYRALIRLLHRAASNTRIKDTMDAEDEILEEFANLERRIGRRDERIEEQDKALREKDRTLEEKDKALTEQSRALAEERRITEALRKRFRESQG